MLYTVVLITGLPCTHKFFLITKPHGSVIPLTPVFSIKTRHSPFLLTSLSKAVSLQVLLTPLPFCVLHLTPYSLCYGLNVCAPTPNSYVDALTPHVTVFGDRACKEVLRLNEAIRVGTQSTRAGALKEGRDVRALSAM